MDRSITFVFFGVPAVRVGGFGSFELLLHADSNGERGESAADAEDRHVVPEAAVLRVSSNDGMAARTWLGSQRKASGSPDATDGIAGCVTGTAHESPAPTASSVSISSEGSEDTGTERSVVFGHHVYPNETGVSVPGGGHGLVQPLRAGMGAFQLVGDSVLPRCLGKISRQRAAGNLQHRPGLAIHQRRLHRTPGRRGNPDQYGWPRSGYRQHLHRAVVEKREIRGHISARLHRRDRNTTWPGSVLPILQHRKKAPGTRESDAGGSPCRLRNAPARTREVAVTHCLDICHGIERDEIVNPRASEGLKFFRSPGKQPSRCSHGRISEVNARAGGLIPPVASLQGTLQWPPITERGRETKKEVDQHGTTSLECS